MRYILLLLTFAAIIPASAQSATISPSPSAESRPAQNSLENGLQALPTTLGAPLSAVNAGSFIKGSAHLYMQSLLNGCNPAVEFHAVQYNYGTEALTGCASGKPEATTHQITGVAGYATSSNSGAPDAVGVYSQARGLVNGSHAMGGNDVTQDVADLTSGIELVGREIDVQPYNSPSAYNAAYGLNLVLYGNNYAKTGCTKAKPCNYGFSAIAIHSGPNAGGQTWNRGIEVAAGSIVNTVLYVQPIQAAAVAGTNYNSPNLWTVFNTGWNSKLNAAFTNEWTANSRIEPGNNPQYDMFYNQIVGPANSVIEHHFTLTSYQNMDLAFIHSDSSFSRIGVSSSLKGINSLFILPSTNGVGVVASSVTQHAILMFTTTTGSTTDAAVAPSSLSDNGKTVSTTEPLSAATFGTATNAAGVGTAENPSLVAAGSAAAGAFSCSVAASRGTCTISDAAVTANSQIMVQFVGSVGSRLGVKCNTSPTGMPPFLLATQAAGTFTISLPTFTVNPMCGIFTIVN